MKRSARVAWHPPRGRLLKPSRACASLIDAHAFFVFDVPFQEREKTALSSELRARSTRVIDL
jgi:hypothetical protein